MLPEHFVSAAILSLVVLVGLPGSVLVFLVVSLSRRFHIMRHVLLASLALCDFLNVVLVILFRSISLWAEEWVFGMPWCYGSAFASRMLFFVTSLHLWAITHERYKAIVKEPLTYNGELTRRKALFAVAFLWVFPLSVSTAVSAEWNFEYNDLLFVCISQSGLKTGKQLVAGAVVAAVFLIIPLVAMARMNFAILKCARAHAKLLNTTEEHNASAVERQTWKRRLKENKAAIDVLLIVGAFLLTFLPKWVLTVYCGITEACESVPFAVVITVNCAVHLNSIWNPIIYSVRKRDFRKTVVKVFRKSVIVVAETEV